MIECTYPDDGSLPKNLLARRPLHYEGLSGGLWGPWIVEMAKDVAAVAALTHFEEADADLPPKYETYIATVADVRWWSPAAFGLLRFGPTKRDRQRV